MSFRYHGNYCGPGWSGGKYQPSIPYSGKVKSIDEFDETCKVHDSAYAIPGSDLNAADELFYQQNIGKGLKRSLAGIIVKGNTIGRLFKRQKIMPPANRKNIEYATPPTTAPRQQPIPMEVELPEFVYNDFDMNDPFSGKSSKKVMTSQSGAYASNNRYAITPNKFSATQAQTYGSATNHEFGGSAGSNNVKVLFVHLGTPSGEMIISVFRAMLAALLHKHGIHFNDWNENIDFAGRLRLNWKIKPTSVQGVIDFVFGAGQSYKNIANAWFNEFELVGFDYNQVEFYRIDLSSRDESDGIITFPIESALYLNTLELHMQQSMTMRAQNQTSPDVGEPNPNVEVFNANPILVKTYYINGSTAENNTPDNIGLTLQQAPAFIPDSFSGYSNYATTNASGPLTMQKLPQSNVFKRVEKTVKPVNITPGQLIQRTVSKHMSMGVQTFFESLFDTNEPSNNFNRKVMPPKLGCCLVMAFEKTLNTRGNVNGVGVGLQWEFFISSFITLKKFRPTNKIVLDTTEVTP